MSVSILVPGRIPENRPMEATCRNCGCVFQFTPQDAKRVNDQRDGDFYSISCPTCKMQVNKQA